MELAIHCSSVCNLSTSGRLHAPQQTVMLDCLLLQDQNGLQLRPQGWTLLHLACAVGQTESAALLLKHGADVQGMPCPNIACSTQLG